MCMAIPFASVVTHTASNVSPSPGALDVRVRVVCAGIDSVGWVTVELGLAWGTWELPGDYWADADMLEAYRAVLAAHGPAVAAELKGAVLDTIQDFLDEQQKADAELAELTSFFDGPSIPAPDRSCRPKTAWGWHS